MYDFENNLIIISSLLFESIYVKDLYKDSLVFLYKYYYVFIFLYIVLFLELLWERIIFNKEKKKVLVYVDDNNKKWKKRWKKKKHLLEYEIMMSFNRSNCLSDKLCKIEEVITCTTNNKNPKCICNLSMDLIKKKALWFGISNIDWSSDRSTICFVIRAIEKLSIIVDIVDPV
jgi:hypothetical protein